MKKILFLLICCCISFQMEAQSGRLYYFINKKDSFVGVKDRKGHITIAANYLNLSFEDGERIPDGESIIVLCKSAGVANKPAQSWGDAFDRKGNFLFHPLIYDNGPDYLSEGYFRCVGNGKVGFANREGKIVIPAQWDWASSFNYGYSLVCNGCYFDYSKDAEHPAMAYYPDHEVYYIDKNGLRAHPTKIEDNSTFMFTTLDGDFLPYSLPYNKAEQSLVDSFNKLSILKEIAFTDWGCTTAKPPIRYEITERPSSSFAFYTIQGFEKLDHYISGNDAAMFLVDKKGNWFHFDSFSHKKTTFKRWLEQRRKGI